MSHGKELLWSAILGFIAFSGGYVLYTLLTVVIFALETWLSPDQAWSSSFIYRHYIFNLSRWLPYWIWGVVAGMTLYYAYYIRPLPPFQKRLLMGSILLCTLLHCNGFKVKHLIEFYFNTIFTILVLIFSFRVLHWMLNHLAAISSFAGSLWEQLQNR